jgi:hypothetical protein
MPAYLNGDFSKYPDPIQGTFPYIAAETCVLRQAWAVYHRLFIEDKRLTGIMSQRLGGLLGLFQTMLQDAMLLSIARLTDKDNRSQPNLSLWCLEKAIPFAKGRGFSAEVSDSLRDIWTAADNIRKHRHKRIAHFDRNVSLKVVPLPQVRVAEIKVLIEMIEKCLNLFFWEFERSTMMFDTLPGYGMTGAAEVSAFKALTYDLFEQNGTIPHNEWRKQRKV